MREAASRSARSASAAPHDIAIQHEKEEQMEHGLMALGAGIAVGLAALGTGFAQAKIGAAGMAAIAEKPELTGRAILMVAIPETLVILGFAVAAMILVLL
jgi:V/A-type H+-transporting ATPase subunit K